MISEARRRQYLDALGLDAWVSRARLARHRTVPVTEALPDLMADAPELLPGSYILGPGAGQTLLLCSRQEDASSKLASDIARCLDEAPVWGWQAPAGRAASPETAGMSLEAAIRDRLFTRVLVFGAIAPSTASQNAVIGSARVIQAPGLVELAGSAEQKRSLWLQLVANGWCKRFA